MILYLFIGLIVSITFDYVMKQLPVKELQFTNWERLVLVGFWPLAVIFAIYGFLKGGQ